MIDLSTYIQKETDCIYIHLCNDCNDNFCQINTDINWKNKFQFKNKRTFTHIIINNLCYSYDHQNDNQNVIKYELLNFNEVEIDKNKILAITCYKEVKMQSFEFPCIKDYSYKTTFSISEYKINSRLSFFIKDDKIPYLLYKHSENFDIDKINSDLNNFIQQLLAIY
jgi:hypothetical protein